METDATMEIDRETLKDLMEVGCLAAGCGLAAQADRVFAGVDAALPGSVSATLGRALVRLNTGRSHEAIDLLRAALETHPNDEVLASFLGLALRMAGMNQAGDEVLGAVASAGTDPVAVAMADAVLNPADE